MYYPRCFRTILIPVVCAIALFTPAATHSQPATAQGRGEAGTTWHMEEIRENPLLLRALLKRMPKGADLHNHLSGAIYAETYLKWGAESNLCLDTSTMTLVACGGPEMITASQAIANPLIYRQVIDAWSMRNWQLSGQNGHDHFFDTFGKFGAATRGRTGDMLAESARRAAENNLSYLELMLTPDGGAVSRLGAQLDWRSDYTAMRDSLLARGLRDSIRIGMRLLDSAEKRMRSLLGCATNADGEGCSVAIRYLYQVGRGGPDPVVFAQILAGFEMAEMDHRMVGFNLVQPEDYPASMRGFDGHMAMIDALRPLYRSAHISLHAGEFAFGLVPPDSLCCHIRSSIELGHAERIGHGVSVMYEDAPFELLRLMKTRNVLVEICLTSNDGILGVRGIDHPFRIYAMNDVPLALCTDDEGVSRSDITNEYLRAVQEQGATYPELKRMARNGLEYAFVQGKSLWSDRESFTMTAECRGSTPGGTIAPACRRYLDENEKARLQWRLEEDLVRFEAEY